ncbi:polysaccharide deacetylase family protein [bacterium]|nr:polysaccharide deacetylase family protein [bacterium]
MILARLNEERGALGTPESKTIPILAYHKITSHLSLDPDSMPMSMFDKQLRFIHGMGYRAVKTEELIENPFQASGGKKFMLAFDDAYETTVRNSFHILKKYNFSGIIFVITGYMGKRNYWDTRARGKFKHLTEAQIKRLSKTGLEFGSHTVNHENLLHLTNEKCYRELKDSKEHLENMLGKPVLALSYPFGKQNERIQEIARKAGYKLGVCIHNSMRKYNPMAVRSWGIYPWDTRASVRGKLVQSGFEQFKLNFIKLGSEGAALLNACLRRND